jgi:hypothetical protein
MGHTILSIAEARRVARMPDQYQGWVKLNDAAKFQEPGWVKLEPPVQHQAESAQAAVNVTARGRNRGVAPTWARSRCRDSWLVDEAHVRRCDARNLRRRPERS